MRRKRPVLAIVLTVLVVSVGCAAGWSFATAGSGDLPPGPVDALIVFGSPAEFNGSPSPMQLWRVHAAVTEFQRGAAPHLILAGGAAGNKFVEAEVMARIAMSQGVPPAAILTEGHSLTTEQNLRNTAAIMHSHGWKTAELISSADHLPRIAFLARTAPFRWRLHAAPTPGRGRLNVAWAYMEEAGATLVLRTFGSAAEPIVHAVAVCEHALFFLPRWVLWKLQQHLAH